MIEVAATAMIFFTTLLYIIALQFYFVQFYRAAIMNKFNYAEDLAKITGFD
jgi:hypothetical protein